MLFEATDSVLYATCYLLLMRQRSSYLPDKVCNITTTKEFSMNSRTCQLRFSVSVRQQRVQKFFVRSKIRRLPKIGGFL